MMARIAAAIVVALSAVLVFWGAGNLGVWEPWESGALRLAIEVSADAPAPDEGEDQGAEEPAAEEAREAHASDALGARAQRELGEDAGRFSGLRLWSLTQTVDDEPVVESGEVGGAERGVRAPMMLMALLLLVGVWLWTRRYLGERAAWLSAVILATTPAVLLGAIFVSGPIAMMVTTTLAMLGFVGLALEAQRRRAPEGSESEEMSSRHAYIWLGVGALSLALAIWEGGIFGGLMPLATLLIVALLEWRSPAGGRPIGRALLSWRGLVWIVPALLVAWTLAGDTSWGHLLTHHGFAENVDFGDRFGWWIRQIGFGFFPWFALAFAAYGYMSHRLSGSAAMLASSPATEDAPTIDPTTVLIARVLMLWPAVAFAVMALGGRFGHATFAAFVPLALGVAWALSDKRYWEELRLKPQLYLLIALSAIFVVMMLGKDLERFPARLVELVTSGQDELGLGEDYEFGRALKLWKYGYVALLAAYFAGAISWLVFFWRDLKVFGAWCKRTWKSWRAKESAADNAAETQESPSEDAGAELAASASLSAGEFRAAEREDFRAGEGLLSKVAAFAEGYSGLLIVATLGALSWSAIMIGVFLPDLDSNLSNRKVVASYLDAKQGDEPLLRYGFDASQSDFYLRGLESIAHARAFNARFEEEERFFALIPRDRLAAVHSDVRRAHKADLVVVDNSSASMVLVSNKLGDGEDDQSPLSGALLNELPASATPITVEGDPGNSPAFERQIELIGYELNKASEHGKPARYAWGEEMTMTLYFNTLRRVTSEQEIFVHIDTPGNRIGADHEPVGGAYPTNRWLPGDIVRDKHTLTIERYSTPGTYTIWMGFYKGSTRMDVTPGKGHDGQNRVKVAEIEIEAF